MTLYSNVCIQIATRLKHSNVDENTRLSGNEALDDWFDKKISQKLDEIGRKLVEWLSTALSWIVDLIAIGVIIYIMYNVVKWIFIPEKDTIQRIMFLYLCLLLLRLLSGMLTLDITT